MDHLVGLRVELTADLDLHKVGEKGVIGKWHGYIGVMFDSRPQALVLTHGKQPITNFVKIVEDDRLSQRSFFED